MSRQVGAYSTTVESGWMPSVPSTRDRTAARSAVTSGSLRGYPVIKASPVKPYSCR